MKIQLRALGDRLRSDIISYHLREGDILKFPCLPKFDMVPQHLNALADVTTFKEYTFKWNGRYLCMEEGEGYDKKVEPVYIYEME